MDGRGRISIEVAQQDRNCVLQVRDNGPGVAPQIQQRVFEPFYTTKARGGGLGLPIARRTAELHGGTLTLSCPREGGTLMTLTLPLHAAPPGSSALPAE
jgi:two-component system sensor histidine kinase FlrB